MLYSISFVSSRKHRDVIFVSNIMDIVAYIYAKI